MRILKLICLSIPVFSIMILVGCGDVINTSGEYRSSGKNDVKEISDEVPQLKIINVKIRLKPNMTYKLDVNSTGLDKFFYIRINKIRNDTGSDKLCGDCSDVYVYSSFMKENIGCINENIDVNELTIQNTGLEMIDLAVRVQGIKQSKPFVKKRELE